jgi:LytS/YehU family sensor histidine kinase
LLTGITLAKLEALRMQINRHFVFNTLNSISSLIPENPKGADEMIGLLSDLLRATLKASNQQDVALSEELSYLTTYLAIQKVRFTDRIQVHLAIAPSTLPARVPILILQPLVENAIRHGIETTTIPGTVFIRSRQEQNTLWLEVENSGPGLMESCISPPGSGVGLSNIKSRLETLYGNLSGLDVEENVNGGVIARIHLPFSQTQDKK